MKMECVRLLAFLWMLIGRWVMGFESFQSVDWIKRDKAHVDRVVRVLFGVKAENSTTLEEYFWKVSDPR